MSTSMPQAQAFCSQDTDRLADVGKRQHCRVVKREFKGTRQHTLALPAMVSPTPSAYPCALAAVVSVSPDACWALPFACTHVKQQISLQSSHRIK